MQCGPIRMELELTDCAEFAELRLDRLCLYLYPGGNEAHDGVVAVPVAAHAIS